MYIYAAVGVLIEIEIVMEVEAVELLGTEKANQDFLVRVR